MGAKMKAGCPILKEEEGFRCREGREKEYLGYVRFRAFA